MALNRSSTRNSDELQAGAMQRDETVVYPGLKPLEAASRLGHVRLFQSLAEGKRDTKKRVPRRAGTQIGRVRRSTVGRRGPIRNVRPRSRARRYPDV